MASCPTPPRPRSDSINHIVSMEPMNVPALKLLCDADDAAEELGFRFVLDPPPNIPCKRGNDDNDGGNNNDEASSSSFVPIERAHRSSVSDPIVKIRPRPSRALFAASSTAASTAHSSINMMNVGMTFTPIDDDDDDDEEEEVKLTSSSPPRAKPKSAAANIITPTKAMMTRSIMNKKSYKLAVRNNNRSSKRKEVRSTVNKNATAAATTSTTTPHPSSSSPAAA